MENVQRIPYEIEDRAAVMEQIATDGKIIVLYAVHDPDESGRPTNCYFEVIDAPPEEP